MLQVTHNVRTGAINIEVEGAISPAQLGMLTQVLRGYVVKNRVRHHGTELEKEVWTMDTVEVDADGIRRRNRKGLPERAG